MMMMMMIIRYLTPFWDCKIAVRPGVDNPAGYATDI